MEGNSSSSSSSSSSSEMDVIYFLSRHGNGCTEHPHLIRIHHHTSPSVKLRDVKRWLGDLRGKNMPHQFSWSFKRKYREGYVWQDLGDDDDVIDPILGSEYVLKGSEIIPYDTSTNGVSTKMIPPSTINEQDEIQLSKEQGDESVVITASESIIISNPTKTSSKPTWNKSKNTLRNLINCGSADANESAVVRRMEACGSDVRGGRSTEVFKLENRNGGLPAGKPSWKRFGGSKSKRASGATYYPPCSQCEKTFKPEKLQSHMKSCKGIAEAKGKFRNVETISTLQT